MDNNPLVSILTVTYNSSDFIVKSLKAVIANTHIPFEVIIVDNHSQDDTLDKIRKSGIKVKLIPQASNLGFSKANNIAVKESSGEYLMFLNPDTQVKNNCIDELLHYLKTHSKVGLVAPQLIESGKNIQRSVRRLPTIFGAFKEYYLKINNSYEDYHPTEDVPEEVDSVVGAAMLIKKDVYIKSGGFSEKYFMYFEDLELCKNIKKIGLKIIYLPIAQAIHKIGASAATNSKTSQYLKDSAEIYHGKLTNFFLQLILKARILFR